MGLCPPSQYTPNYDNQFFRDIEKCPQSPASEYCKCYDQAALDSQIRAQEARVRTLGQSQQDARDAYENARHYPIMSPGDSPPLNVPSRADQKKNTFSKVFDPKKRKIIVLLIAAVLLFVALVSAD